MKRPWLVPIALLSLAGCAANAQEASPPRESAQDARREALVVAAEYIKDNLDAVTASGQLLVLVQDESGKLPVPVVLPPATNVDIR